jgi:hypothetical protein
VKIREVRAAAINISPHPKTAPSVPKLDDQKDWGGPMARYPEFRKSDLNPGDRWSRTACVVTAEDGT